MLQMYYIAKGLFKLGFHAWAYTYTNQPIEAWTPQDLCRFAVVSGTNAHQSRFGTSLDYGLVYPAHPTGLINVRLGKFTVHAKSTPWTCLLNFHWTIFAVWQGAYWKRPMLLGQTVAMKGYTWSATKCILWWFVSWMTWPKVFLGAVTSPGNNLSTQCAHEVEHDSLYLATFFTWSMVQFWCSHAYYRLF